MFHTEVVILGVNGTAIKTDDDLGALVTVEAFHSKVHDGEAYRVSHIFEQVADDATASYYLTTSATKETHIKVSVAAEGLAFARAYSGATVSGGTAQVARNLKIGDAGVADTLFSYTSSVTNAGTLEFETIIPGGTGNKTVGDTARTDGEWEVEKSTTMLFTLVNKGAAAKEMSMTAEFYEV